MKSILDRNDYFATITQVIKKENSIEIGFTIDTGPFAYQTLISEFPLTEKGIFKLQSVFKKLNIDFDIDSIDDDFFELEYLGIRSKILVDVYIQGDIIKNKILEYNICYTEPEYYVMDDPSDEKYFKIQSGRKLPIQKKTKDEFDN